MMTWYRTPAAQGGAGKTKATTNWNKTYDYNRAGWMFLRDTLKCTYPTTSAAYTGAMGGYPVGDLNWWPSRKNSWLIYVTDARNQENVMPQQFSLNQNYPNPFNPSTTISFSLTNSAMTTLSVYNLLGQRVSTLVSQPLQAGNYEYHFDGTNLASGIYYYQLESGNSFAVKKMIMMK
jgi:hypothetical protein